MADYSASEPPFTIPGRILVPAGLDPAYGLVWKADGSFAIVYKPNTTQTEVLVANATGTAVSGILTSFTAPAASQLTLNTTTDSTQVRLNSRSFTQTSGDSMSFQAKPSQTVSSSGNVIGGQISPRLQSAVALTGSGSLIGLHVDTDLKGTAGGNIAGDVRGMEIEMVSDASSGRTVSGDVSGIRFRTNLDATVTGQVIAIRVPTGEASGGQWDGFAKFDAVAGVFVAPGNTTALANMGYIKIYIGTTAYRIPVLEDE